MKWLFFAFALVYGDTCVQVGKPESGRIEVVAKDATGATLRGNYVLIVMDGNQAIHTQTVSTNRSDSLAIELK